MPPPSQRVPLGAALALVAGGVVTLVGVALAYTASPRIAHAEKAAAAAAPPAATVLAPTAPALPAAPRRKSRRSLLGPEDFAGGVVDDDLDLIASLMP
jgi:hypothetical protein